MPVLVLILDFLVGVLIIDFTIVGTGITKTVVGRKMTKAYTNMSRNYRIKKVTRNGQTEYYPQEKIFFWWWNVGDDIKAYEHFENANRYLVSYIIQSELNKNNRKTEVEYIRPDFELAHREPNPPPRVP